MLGQDGPQSRKFWLSRKLLILLARTWLLIWLDVLMIMMLRFVLARRRVVPKLVTFVLIIIIRVSVRNDFLGYEAI